MSEYKIHKAWIEEAEFEILVIELPDDKEEIEDKLAFLAREKGNITKNYYEDFVIVTCVANINQMLFHIKQQHINSPDLQKVREQVMAKVLEINPALNPEKLILNRNSVLKIRREEILKEDERPLVENKAWETSYYDGETSSRSETDLYPLDEDLSIAPSKNAKVEDPKSVDSLDTTVVKKWWRRINRYIEIKKFKESDAVNILSQRFFHNRQSFQTYIVSVCVIDSEDLFIMLDNMGIPNRTSPPILMHEIYEFCLSVNPFLTYEGAQDYNSGTDYEEDCSDKNDSSQASRSKLQTAQVKKKSKKPKKRFKDVPKTELLKLGDSMKNFIIGQNEAVDKIVRCIQRASVGLKDPERPIGSFLFAGRTGTGKSLTGKVLADELIKDRNNLITIDCSEYSADHEYSKLIGAPPSYIGHDQGGALTNAIMENPFSVVVFDEVEKASTKVHELLLQILDEGRLTDGKGNKVSFRDAIVILTSNVGVTEVDDVKKTLGFGNVAELTEERKNRSIESAIKKKFKPEFINRLDSIVHFNTLVKNDYMKIIDIELYKLNDNLRNNDTEYKTVALEFDKRVKDLVFKEGINEDYGARPLKRCIETRVSDKIAEVLLSGEIPVDSKIKVSVKKNDIVFSHERNSAPEFEINSDVLGDKSLVKF